MRIYVFAQHTTRAGQVCLRDEDWCEASADVWLFGEGTEKGLVRRARNILQNDDYSPMAKREADHVLEHLGE